MKKNKMNKIVIFLVLILVSSSLCSADIIWSDEVGTALESTPDAAGEKEIIWSDETDIGFQIQEISEKPSLETEQKDICSSVISLINLVYLIVIIIVIILIYYLLIKKKKVKRRKRKH
jgi:hypothetical protein